MRRPSSHVSLSIAAFASLLGSAACGEESGGSSGSTGNFTALPDSGSVLADGAVGTGGDGAVTSGTDSGLTGTLPTDGGSLTDAAVGTDGSVGPGDGSIQGDAATEDAGSGNPLDKYGLTPFPTSGEPLTAPNREWTYIEFPDTQCRDGSPAGIALRTNSESDDLMIFLEGGGACFDDLTCLANPGNTAPFQSEQAGGILNPDDPSNPLKDWNLVYVPYCTGDVHIGTKADSDVSALFPKQQFVGYLNLQKFLDRVVPTFPDPERLLLTGISAGGFGASGAAILVQRAFPNEKMMVIDDSGPPQSNDVVPPCLQDRMREVWGLENSILTDCPDCSPTNFLQDFGVHLVETFSDRPSGLIEAVNDSVIAGFFGAGNDACNGVAILTPVDADTFEQGLMDFRDLIGNSPNFSTYFPPGTQHTYLTDLMSVKFADAEVDGVRLTDWVESIVNGQAPADVGP